MSFWLDAVLMHQYLVNHLPTSTLSDCLTLYEVLSNGHKPDLSHLQVWGCDCYVAVPDELHAKAGFKRFRAVSVGYEKHRVGWHVQDLHGKYSFSNDVIFNESSSGHLGVSHPLSSSPDMSPASPDPLRPARDRPHICTAMGQEYDEVLHLKEFQHSECNRYRTLTPAVDTDGDVPSSFLSVAAPDSIGDLSLLLSALDAFFSLIALSFLPDIVNTLSFPLLESNVFPITLHAIPAFTQPSCTFDLTKPPSSYLEAMARSDASIWRAAMDREQQSLADMGAFQEADLPPGQKAVGLKWVYDFKTDVAKIASIHILLAWAAVQDLKIYQFDCKTAFLHTKLCHDLYAHPFSGFETSSLSKVLRILVALYGLRQAAYEFYILLMSLLLECGMIRCEVDHGVFIGEWVSPLDASVTMPSSGSLVLYVPLHVDDGLTITNSSTLYAWFLKVLSQHLHIVDLGPCSKLLSILIIHDCLNHKLWLSSHVYVSSLLDEWHLASCKPASTPFPLGVSVSTPAPQNSLPDLSDAGWLPVVLGCCNSP